MRNLQRDKMPRLLNKRSFSPRTILVCITVVVAAITAKTITFEGLGQVFAQSTENDDRLPRELSAGWDQFGQALVIYSLVLLAISILIVVAHRIHGSMFASEEEQRTRDEWYGGSNDDRDGWCG